jgi:hypothetical protein
MINKNRIIIKLEAKDMLFDSIVITSKKNIKLYRGLDA